ncbi:MAG: glycerophosphodiester phosphodiesterase [Desulfurococcales archaeon]|nr:glycerophosphodiester phosphodiesterase [Desulfurococcales archaeon]
MGFFSDKLAIIAYRGASAYEPENTIPAVVKALELEADGILVDVNVTKDGVLVLFADDAVVIDGKEVGIRSIGYAELKEKVKLGKGSYVPTLEEVIDVVKDRAKLVLVPRADGHEDALIRKLQEKEVIENVVIASRNIEVLRKYKSLDETVKVASIVNHPFPHIDNLRRQGISFILMPPGLIRGRIVKEAHTRGIEVIAWVVNDVATLSKLANLGVDAVVTEKPDIRRDLKHLAEY